MRLHIRTRFAVAVAIVAIVLAACGTQAEGPTSGSSEPPGDGGTGGEATVVFSSYGGAVAEAEDEAWFNPYVEEAGIEFVHDHGNDPARLRAMVESGEVLWDLVDVDPDLGLDSQPWFEEIDCEIVPCDEIREGYLGKHRVGAKIFSTVLGYNTDQLDEAPTSWADFFDLERFPGNRGVRDYVSGGILEIALLADGVAPDDLYPLDVDRALAKLDTIKDDIVYWSSGSQSQDLLGSGEVAMAMIFNGRAWSAKHADNNPVEISWDNHLMQGSYFVIPKGAPNKDAAMELLAYVVSAENNGRLSSHIPYAPTNVNSEVDPEMEPDLPTSHSEYVLIIDEYYEENFSELDSQFQDWKTR